MEIKRLANNKTGPEVEPITNVHHVAHFQRIINGYWREKNRSNKQFPGPLPISLERKDMHKLTKFPYVVSEKTNGMRFFILATKHKGNNIAIVIDRGYRINKIDIEFPDDYYDNTLLDGELVYYDNEWVYYIHDCIAWCGENMVRKKFFERYSCVVGITSTGNFKICLKNMMELNLDNLNFLLDEMEQSSRNTDGLVFTPVNLPIGTGTQYSLFKYKTVDNHTFDFRIAVSDDTLTCYISKSGNLVEFMKGDLAENEDIKEFYEKLQKLDHFENKNHIVECTYDPDEDKYEPILIRNDKLHPNGFLTVQKTYLNIKENITLDDIREIVSDR